MSRHDRVQEAIRKEVSLIVHDQLKDPRLGFVTITSVELTPDLRYAKVFYSVLGKDEDYTKTKQALDSASGFIRKEVCQRVKLRLAPEISFREDRTGEYSVRIQQVLDEIKELNDQSPSGEEGVGDQIKNEETVNKIRKEDRGESKKSKRGDKKQ
ncbi:MAG: 30S ribosome-binding factor RbfA [Candidatus Omnitrophota bacterium]|nr:30S ribosome-binding factor RbfA [Candidatus Omnitrophota bacterium]MBU1929537.1 30S ribosome-binding factor RbfA [Candidatus Omnitrophota bacterium]MBU2035824.1 30S ribosome-binding factor RbfA [Candidatus Omnitrophota bacterium]MBU2221392.1 30S ribosome-binding factor RbfA [Candidatus Omnitrophota bacterium]MBU2258396.1 30S ribosome-binding factor RbfA [Candidatus Omnitrophota bacterium]